MPETFENLFFTKTEKVKSPERGTPGSAGIDFFIPFSFKTRSIQPGEHIRIPSGIRVKIPEGTALIAMNKSGISLNQKLLKTAELIDSDYSGELNICLYNAGAETVELNPGQKIIQLIHVPVFNSTPREVFPDVIENMHKESVRKDGGFGSTGL